MLAIEFGGSDATRRSSSRGNHPSGPGYDGRCRPSAWREAIDRLASAIAPHKPDVLAGIEARGYLVASPLALELNRGLIKVGKRRKQLDRTVPYAHRLECGKDAFVEVDAVEPGVRIVVVDDVLATGQTMDAAVRLLRRCGGNVIAGACHSKSKSAALREVCEIAVFFSSRSAIPIGFIFIRDSSLDFFSIDVGEGRQLLARF